MEPTLPPPDPATLEDHVRRRGFAEERLVSLNGLISLILLTWSVLVLRRPALARRAAHAIQRRFPWLVGGSPRE